MRSPLKSSIRLYILIYVSVMALAALFFTPSHFSTNMLSIFPQNSYTKQLDDASKLQSLNRLIVISKGDDKSSLERLEKVAEALKDVHAIDRLFFKVGSLNTPSSRYLREHYVERLDINSSRSRPEYVKKRLQTTYNEMISSFIFSGLNVMDPLALFSDPLQQQGVKSHQGVALFNGVDYMLSATLKIKVSDVEASQQFYDEVHAIVDRYGDELITFAPHFFSAENATKIKGEVNLIVAATMVLLLLFYAFTLRDVKVLFLSSLALGSSLFVGLSAVTALFDDVSIFTLAFGSGIAMMAVDYFFHLYFHGFYTQAIKERQKVFYAFLTTVSGFGILYFADFPLIEQLALFGMVALTFSYFQFAFLFTYWEFEPKLKRIKIAREIKGFIDVKLVSLLSLVLLLFGLSQLHFSGDLRQLDYQNQKLLALQEQIKAPMSQEAVLLFFAPSVDALLVEMEALKSQHPALRSLASMGRSKAGFKAYEEELRSLKLAQLKEEVSSVADAIGFRAGTFKNSYDFVNNLYYSEVNLTVAKTLGFETIRLEEGRWMSLAYLSQFEADTLKYGEQLVRLEASTLLKKGVESVFDQLRNIALITFGFITLLLIVLLKKRVLIAMNYMLFPLALITTTLALQGSFSVMHLFALIIVMVAAIDYGIYMSDAREGTDEAIYYAMLTTFAGFGIFVFSNIGALHHIGLVIALGIASTFVLQMLQKRS